jgi:hypothetical protein
MALPVLVGSGLLATACSSRARLCDPSDPRCGSLSTTQGGGGGEPTNPDDTTGGPTGPAALAVSCVFAAPSRAERGAPRPSPSPAPLLDPNDLGSAEPYIRRLHPTSTQETQLRQLGVATRKLVYDTIQAKQRALTEEERIQITNDARAKAKTFLTPQQYKDFCEYEANILFAIPFRFKPTR